MSLEFSDDFEDGLGDWTTSGSIEASAVEPITGTKSCRTYPSSGSGYARRSATANIYTVEAKIKIKTAPDSDLAILGFDGSSYWKVVITTDRYLDLYEGATKRVDGTTQLTLDVAYTVRYLVDSTVGYYYIGGVQEGTYDGTNATLINSGQNYYIGISGTGTCEVRIDDLYMYDTVEYPAAGLLVPVAVHHYRQQRSN